jgi:uncharacterized protein YdhG (YjbR/CyaY superfamily)
MKTEKPAGVQVREYLAALPAEQRKVLRGVRDAIRSAAPKAVEHFSYGIPGFRLHGQPLLWYAVWRRHISLYPVTPAIRQTLAADIEGYETSKGTIRFPLDQPPPVSLVKKIVRARAREAAARSKG